MRTWPVGLRPAICVGDRRIVTVVGPPEIAVLSEVPSACESASTGMVIVASVPDGENPPATLFTRRQPTAPAFCAFLTLIVKLQSPRSITAILPRSWAPFVITSQPSFTGAVPSTARIACAVSPPSVTAPPNVAVLAASEPLPNGTTSSGEWLRNSGALKFVCWPSQVRLLVLIAEATRWASVFWSQCRCCVSSKRNLSNTDGSAGGPFK
jgi:hypothetical protein